MIQEKHKILISEEKIQKRIQEIGAQITQDYKNKDLVVICILKGAFMFCADLIRKIKLPLSCEFYGVSSYGDETKSSGALQTTLDISIPLKGKHLLIVEDIVDTGLTIDYLKRNFQSREPKSVKTCSLLLKPSCLQKDIKIDYLGFEIGMEFVVGYGMDLAGKYRNTPDLLVLTDRVLTQ